MKTWPAALLGAALASPVALAFAITPVLGPQDLPVHAMFAGLAARPDPLPPFAARVDVWPLVPYRSVYDLLGVAGPGGVEPLLRAVLAVTALALPAAAAVAAAALPGAEPRLAAALAVVPLTGFLLWSGFIGFLLACPLVLLTLAAALRLQAGARPGPQVALAAASLAGSYLLHPFALALAVAVLAAATLGRRRRPLVGLTALGVGLVLLTALVLLRADRGPADAGGTDLRAWLSHPERVVGQVALLARGSWVHLGSTRAAVAAASAAVAALGALVAVIAGVWTGARAGAPRGTRLALLGAVAPPLVLLGALPNFAFGVAYVGSRFAAPALLALAVGVAGVGGRAPRRAREGALALALTGALGLSLGAASALLDVGRELAPVREVAAALAREPGPRRVLALTFEPRTEAVQRWFAPACNAADWALLLAGDADPRFTPNPCVPVRTGVGAPEIPPVLGPAGYDPDRHAPFTHVVVRLGAIPGEEAALRRVERDHALVFAAGDWRLYRRR